ncbi:MAG: TlpA family protein disulfide reductase [Deltaproteobacteria bacterium]|nr:TlpA family protein disulfide reductase [Deltaproteobacteria bacterium]
MAVIVIAVVAVVIVVILSQKRSFEHVVAGTDSIDFTLPDLDGKQVSLKDFRGKVVFLNFWATWCKPCEDEMPSMQALYNGMKGQPFEIIAVSIDSDGTEVVKAYAKKYGITFTVLHDRSGKVKEAYKTTGVPETFIIDQNGVIAEKVWGPRDWTRMDSLGVVFDLIKNGPKQKGAYKPDKSADRR